MIDNEMLSITPALPGVKYLKFFPSGLGGNAEVARGKTQGSGTGWHVCDGYFVTNEHVIKGAETISIEIEDQFFPARAVVVDRRLDLAVLKIDQVPENVGCIPISTNYAAGQTVYAVGFPLGRTLGRETKITDGLIVSVKGIEDEPSTMTISAPIQLGSSGGPLLDEFGNVVGVVAAKLRDIASQDSDVENVNFAVRSDYLLPMLAEFNIVREPLHKKLSNDTYAALSFGSVCGSVQCWLLVDIW